LGYRGKQAEQGRARELRAQSWTLQEIAAELGVAKSSVSLWVRDVEFTPKQGQDHNFGARDRTPNALQRRKAEEIEHLRAEGVERIGRMTDRELLLVGTALYAGEGAKRDGMVRFANSDPRMIVTFLAWLRRCFEVDEERLRLRLYLHEGLDLDAANRFWSELTGIPVAQFGKPYRAVPDPSIRTSKHPMGCPSVGISCSRTHRAVMGLVDALLSCGALPG
jgi:transcriptional regulator with XRE-family HTH domain